TGGKRMVDVDKVRDIIDDIRLNMPAEIRQAKAIVQDRADIVATARAEADTIVKRAEDRARTLISDTEIVKQAQQRSTELMSSAQSHARETRNKMTEYCDNMLKTTEELLAKNSLEVKSLRQNLRKTK
ncbi:MAG: ATPase, partial [Oscillospiraceae bacterium]